MRDITNHINIRPAIPPAAAITDNTVLTTSILDLQGFGSACLAIGTGVLLSTAATFAVALFEADDLAFTTGSAVNAIDMNGTTALAGFNQAADNLCFKIGYCGNKRYIRATVTPTGNNAGAPISAVWILGHPAFVPTANPPV